MHIDMDITLHIDFRGNHQLLGILGYGGMAKKTLPQLELLVEKYAQMTARQIEIALSKDRADADDSEDHDKDTCNAEDCPMDHDEESAKKTTASQNYEDGFHSQTIGEVKQLWQDQGRLKELHSKALQERYDVVKIAERMARKHSL